MIMSFIIAGLGNPGEEYNKTRHNTGMIVADVFAKENDLLWKEDPKRQAVVAEGKIGKEKFTFLKPQTFMNRSGKAVGLFVKNPKQAETLVVIHDDLDLPIGRMKISFGKHSGGHKGVESIIKAIKTINFIRLRVGIAPTTPTGKIKKPSGDKLINDFIIKPFSPAEAMVFKKVTKKAAEALAMIIAEGKEKAMGEYNSV